MLGGQCRFCAGFKYYLSVEAYTSSNFVIFIFFYFHAVSVSVQRLSMLFMCSFFFFFFSALSSVLFLSLNQISDLYFIFIDISFSRSISSDVGVSHYTNVVCRHKRRSMCLGMCLKLLQTKRSTCYAVRRMKYFLMVRVSHWGKCYATF